MKVYITKYKVYANVVSTIVGGNGEMLYWCDNTDGMGRIFSANELVFV